MKCILCGTELGTCDNFEKVLCLGCMTKTNFYDAPMVFETPQIAQGWMCPRCGRVHSPYTATCFCVPPTVTCSNYCHGNYSSDITCK